MARRQALGAGVGAWGAERERAGRAAWARRGRGVGAGDATWARTARGLGVPVRMVGMLAGSAGPVWVLVNLA